MMLTVITFGELDESNQDDSIKLDKIASKNLYTLDDADTDASSENDDSDLFSIEDSSMESEEINSLGSESFYSATSQFSESTFGSIDDESSEEFNNHDLDGIIYEFVNSLSLITKVLLGKKQEISFENQQIKVIAINNTFNDLIRSINKNTNKSINNAAPQNILHNILFIAKCQKYVLKESMIYLFSNFIHFHIQSFVQLNTHICIISI